MFIFKECNDDGGTTEVEAFKCTEEVNLISVVYGRRGEIQG